MNPKIKIVDPETFYSICTKINYLSKHSHIYILFVKYLDPYDSEEISYSFISPDLLDKIPPVERYRIFTELENYLKKIANNEKPNKYPQIFYKAKIVYFTIKRYPDMIQFKLLVIL